MATYYFRGSVDSNWDTPNNWWDDPSAGNQGFTPSSIDDAVILATLTTASSSTITVNSITINSGGSISGLSVPVVANVECANGGTIEPLGVFTMTGDLLFSGSGSTLNSSATDYIYIITGNLSFSGTWSGSVDYINGSGGDTIYYYGYTGTASNLSVVGSVLYAGYPTLYYNNSSADGDWGNYLNWWVDSGYSQRSANIPGPSDDVYVAGTVTGGSETVNSATFSGGYTITINLNVTNDVTFIDNNYGDGLSNVGIVANNVYFNSPNGSYSIQASASINFGNECRLTGSSTNSGTIAANGNGLGATYFDDTSINDGYVGTNPSLPYTVDFSDSSTNLGTVNINTNVNYPVNRNTFNAGTINGAITYVNYPSNFYFYGGNDWNNTSFWWTGSLGTGDNAGYVPGALDTVIIQAAPSITANDIYVDNMTIDGPAFILANNSYTVYVTNLLTVQNGSVGDGMTGTNIVSASATFNNASRIWTGSNLTVSAGCSFNGTSDIDNGSVTGEVYFYDSSTFSGGTITGNATVYSPHPAPLVVGGTITGSLSYSGYPNRTVYYNGAVDSTWSTVGNWWDDDTYSTPAAYAPDSAISLDHVVISSNITSGTTPAPTVDSMLVKGSADVSIDITCYTATFEDSSTFSYYNHTYLYPQSVLTQVNAGTVSITFSELSGNYGTIYVADYGAANTNNPPVVFEDGAYVGGGGAIYGNVHIYYPVDLPYDMTINYGSVTYFGYTYYFNDSVGASPSNDGDWNNGNNWYLDSANSAGAGNPPTETYPGENVILQTSVTTSTGGSPTAYNLSCGANSSLSITNIGITVNGLATFENGGILGNAATINGHALFKDTSTCQDGSVVYFTTFTLSSAAEMIYNGYNGSYVVVQFEYGKGVNGSSILGIV